jgi:hypothetical protein
MWVNRYYTVPASMSGLAVGRLRLLGSTGAGHRRRRSAFAKPESAGLRSEPIDALVKWLEGFDEANIHGIVVVRHGMLLFEHYRTGEDECWGVPLGKASPTTNTPKPDPRKGIGFGKSRLLG